MISVLAKDLGGPYKVASAIQKYNSIEKMDEELEAKKAELENLVKETSEKASFLNTLNYTLSEAKDSYEQSRDVRLVVELLRRVLNSSLQRIDENPEFLSMHNPAWDVVYESIKALVDSLRPFVERA
jgi:chromosome segregation ATPase